MRHAAAILLVYHQTWLGGSHDVLFRLVELPEGFKEPRLEVGSIALIPAHTAGLQRSREVALAQHRAQQLAGRFRVGVYLVVYDGLRGGHAFVFPESDFGADRAGGLLVQSASSMEDMTSSINALCRMESAFYWTSS